MWIVVALLGLFAGLISARGLAQPAPPPRPAPLDDSAMPAPLPPVPRVGASGQRGIAVPPELTGRTVEQVRIVGNSQVATAIIRNSIRTREGDKFDPTTVEEDYQRVYALKRFSNVEARIEPTARGVIVAFMVTEQKLIRSIQFIGNRTVPTADLMATVDLQIGQAIDPFRLSLARQSIENLYRDRNFPFVHVGLDEEALRRDGWVIFQIVQGPEVRVRKVAFSGNRSFTDDKLREPLRTKSWIFIFRPGTFDPEAIEDDVATLRRFYEQKGFFDARVGRTLTFSADQKEMMVTFVIDEGSRYVVDRVTFKGNATVSEKDLRRGLKLTEGKTFDAEVLQRDIRQIVREYSPYGFIYQPQSDNPEYLRIGRRDYPFGVRTVFAREPGKLELVYEITEGKPFRVGRILVAGNSRSQDKLALREMRVYPGQLYNSGELADAVDRLRTTPYFSDAKITPIGDDPAYRDVLVEVTEGKTASFNIGAGVSSNGGIGGNISFEQRNFDITNWPNSWREMFSDRAFIGAGQVFRVSIEPGTEQTNASVRFYEPWLFDQPYSFGAEGYYRNRVRESWEERYAGGVLSLGKRFNYQWSALLSFKGEDVLIHHIDDRPMRAPEVVDLAGHSTVTSAALTLKRDTTPPGFFPYRGTSASAKWESFGALGGDFTFQKFSASFNAYLTLGEDLLERRTVLALYTDAGYIVGRDPFFERYYGGGIGSVRGFRYRGISPRSGLDDDPIGGSFLLNATVELGFPIYGETLRGVVFSDAGTVEEDVRIGTIRSSIGAGIRLVIPFLGQAPLAIDFAYPLVKDDQDDVQYISFSFGVNQ